MSHKVKLEKSKALRVEKQHRKKYGPRRVYIFKCPYDGCLEEVRVRQDAINAATGFCQVHSHVKRPFECIYNGLGRDHRKPKVEMTYEQFLVFMQETQCHYCSETLTRTPFPTVKGKFLSMAHQLDKKDPKGPYSVENCVSCCLRCNRLKSNWFSYEEFILIGRTLRKINSKRQGSGS